MIKPTASPKAAAWGGALPNECAAPPDGNETQPTEGDDLPAKDHGAPSQINTQSNEGHGLRSPSDAQPDGSNTQPAGGCPSLVHMARTNDSFGSYGQLCSVATGTDAISGRWTLLLLRDLSHGPLRFSELQASNPGISPSVLTARLSNLEEQGLVEQADPTHKGTRRYRLNEHSKPALFAVLQAVADLGAVLTPDQPPTAQQIVSQLETDRAWFLAKHHQTKGSFRLEIGGASIGLNVDQHQFEPSLDVPTEPTATATMSLQTMQAIVTTPLLATEAIEGGDLVTSGDTEAVLQLLASLSAGFTAR